MVMGVQMSNLRCAFALQNSGYRSVRDFAVQ